MEEKEKSQNELYAEQWFSDNGFTIMHNKKTRKGEKKYLIEKEGICDTFVLPVYVFDIKAYMQFYKHAFEMLKRIWKSV